MKTRWKNRDSYSEKAKLREEKKIAKKENVSKFYTVRGIESETPSLQKRFHF